MGIVTAVVSVVDQDSDPVDQVLVRVFDENDVFVTEGETGAPYSPGEVELSLSGDAPGTAYTLRFMKLGWWFSPAASAQVSVTDPPAPDNEFGPYLAVEGSTEQDVLFVAETPGLDPVDGVLLRVYDALDDFVTEGETGSGENDPGELRLSLPGLPDPGLQYTVRVSAPGYVPTDGHVRTIAVLDPLVPPDTNGFTLELVPVALPQPSDPALCRIQGQLANLGLAPISGRAVVFKPMPCFPQMTPALSHHYLGTPTLVRDIILLDPVKVVAEQGLIDVELPRGGQFQVHIHSAEHPVTISHVFQVPDQPTARLEELLFPYPVSTVFAPTTLALSVGEAGSAVVEATLSDGRVLELDADMLAYLEFESSAPEVATVRFTENLSVEVRGVSAGVATISATRVSGGSAPRYPEIPALVLTSVTVTVT